MSMWRSENIGGGVLRVLVDQPDRSANALSRAGLEQLRELMASLRRDPQLRGVIFRSAKPKMFIAGADVHELKDLGSAEAAREISQFGQAVFKELSELSIPAVALISGACLGGGLEFAMACRYRIADDDPRTLLGLPEVKLGLVPGWGGTVRLPQLVGVADALPMILTGKMLNGRQARSKGLVHDVVATEALDSVGKQIVERHYEAGKIFLPRKKPLIRRLLMNNQLAYRLAFRVAEKQIQEQAHGHYPAPLKAIEVIKTGVLNGQHAGFEAESNAVAELSENPVTTECMRLYFLREASKKPPADLQVPVQPQKISQVGIVGAGSMGAGIALISAQKQIWVRMKDVNSKALASGMQTIQKIVASDVKRKRITALRGEQVLDRISPTQTDSGMRHADLIVEAVVEDLEVKRKVFRGLAERTSPNTVLATNTSSLLVHRIADSMPHPERFVGLHFFNPPHRMPLVEVVRTGRTSPRALATALGFIQRLGKTPVVVGDCPGFLVNRLLAPYMNEVGYLLEEVADPIEIEQAALDFGFPMGPLELTDLVGLQVTAHVSKNMHEAYGSRMEPANLWNRISELLNSGDKPVRLIETGRRGKKRIGSKAKRVITQTRKASGITSFRELRREEIIQRLVYPVINEAARCLEEKVVASGEELDLAMVFGTGFAPFRGGPLRYADSVGIEQIVETLDRLARRCPRLAPCENLRRHLAEKRSFLRPFSEQFGRAAVA